MNSTQEQQNRRNEQDRGPNPNGGSNGADPCNPNTTITMRSRTICPR